MSDATETAVVPTTGVPPPQGARVGPFDVVRTITEGPGATLLEARDGQGRPVLLQVVRLKAARGDAEKEARHQEERRVARRTTELIGEPGFELQAHGGADAEDGTRHLFWALPQVGGLPLAVDGAPLDVMTLLRLARGVAARLADRHGRGRFEPLLSEHTVGVGEAGAPRFFVVPVDAADAWLAAGEQPPRRAPEELDGAPSRSGDVWRLGRLLSAAAERVALPPDALRFVESLCREDPARRPASGAEVLGELDGLLASAPQLMQVPTPVPVALFPHEDVTQSSGPTSSPIPLPEADDPLAVSSWGNAVWTEVGGKPQTVAAAGIPGVATVDPEAPTRAETAEVPGALAGITDPAVTSSPPGLVDAQTDPSALPTLRPSSSLAFAASPELATDPAAAHAHPEAGTDQVVPESADADLEEVDPADVEPLEPEPPDTVILAPAEAVAIASELTAGRHAREADPEATAPVAEALRGAAAAEPEVALAGAPAAVAEVEASAGEPAALVEPEAQAETLAGERTLEDGAAQASGPAVAVEAEPVEAAAGPAGGPALEPEPVEAAAGLAGGPALEPEPVAAAGLAGGPALEAQSVAGEALGGAPVLEAAAQSVVGASDANAGEPAAAQDAGVQPEASGRPALDTEAVPLSVEPDPSGVVAAGQPAQDAEPEASAQPAVEPGAPALESPGAGEVAHTKMEAEAPQEPDAPGTGGLAPAQTDALAASALAAAELASVRDPSTLDDETTLPEGTPRDLAELDAADTLTDDHPVSAVLMRTTAEVDEPEPEDRLAIDAIAAGWEQPVLPAGESPWSEVVSPRGTHRRDYAEFPGFDEDLPRGSNPPAAAPPQAVEYVQEDPSEPSVADVAAAVSGFDTRKVAGGVLAVLVILGLFAFIARSGGGQANAPADVALPGQEFVLESRPAGAWVVAEADGRVLGKTPLAFLVPAGSHPQVFLVAPGHEPMRMELMERGGVEARLLPAGEAGCTVTLSSPDGVQVTAFDDTPVPMGEVPVQGALLVRAAADQEQQGARLVTCPERGGTAKASLHFNPRWAGAPIRITEPAGVAAYMNGDPVGRVPTTGHVDRAFVEVRVDDAEGMSESRWVPARGPLEVRMPTPKPRRRPVLVVPDNRPEDADANVEISAPDTVAPAAPTGRVERLLKAGHKHLKAGRSRKASQAFRECLRIAPNEPTCTEGLGLLYRRIGKADKAKVYFTRFLELVPSGPDAERVRGYLAE